MMIFSLLIRKHNLIESIQINMNIPNFKIKNILSDVLSKRKRINLKIQLLILCL